MKNWIGLLLLRSCVFIERGGTKCGGIHNKFGGGKKQPTEYACITRRGWKLVVERTEPGKIPLCLPILADCEESVLRQSNRHEKPYQKAVAEVSLKE